MFGGLRIGSIIVKGPIYLCMDEDVPHEQLMERLTKLLRIKNRMSKIDDEMAELEAELANLPTVVEGTELIIDRLITMIDDTTMNHEQRIDAMREALTAYRERLAIAVAKGTSAAGEVVNEDGTNPSTEPTA